MFEARIKILDGLMCSFRRFDLKKYELLDSKGKQYEELCHMIELDRNPMRYSTGSGYCLTYAKEHSGRLSLNYELEGGQDYYSNEWKQLKSKGELHWYHFGSNGYLDPQTGQMVTGWYYIDGGWYYFNEVLAENSGWEWDEATKRWIYRNPGGRP